MKKLYTLLSFLLIFTLLVTYDQLFSYIHANASSTLENDVDSVTSNDVFAHDEVISVNIEIDEDVYNDMIQNATEEEYVNANITYDGETYYNVAIRPKGNSSLSQVAQSNGTRFSFKIDFDKYVDNQTLNGLEKINLNNLFKDESLIREYLGYEMLESIGMVASDTTFVALRINDEYYGLYLAVEEVDETFLEANFGNSDGELYKPDMGVGSDLSYISDDISDYSGIFPEDDSMSTDDDYINFVKTIDEIVSNGSETEEYKLSDVMNVDSFLGYLAFSSVTIHLDTYQSQMNHNYYIYYNTDTNLYEWISWDLNMILNNFPVTGMSDEDAMDFLIDEPVLGSLSDYPLVQAVFLNDEYVERYHEYIEELIYGYLNEDAFQEKVLETYTMIETYAQNDPNAFFDFDTTTESIFGESNYSVLHFMSERIEHIEDQLDGTVASTNGGNGNEGTSKGMMGIGGDLNNAGGMRPGIGGDLDNTGEARLDMGGDMMNPGNINDQVMSTEDILAMLPVEVVQLYESGDLPDDIMDAINTGTPPPMDSMQALLDDLGLEMSLPNDTMNNGPSGNRQRPDQNAGTNENMTPPDQNNMMPGENLEQGNMDVSLNPVASNFDLSHVILLTLSLVVSISFSLYLTFKKV